MKKVLKVILSIVIVLTLIFLVGERTPEASWACFWLTKGTALIVLVLAGKGLERCIDTEEV